MMRVGPLVAVGLLVLLALPAISVEPARVESFTPEGSVGRVEQVKVRFSAPIIAFGDPRAASPFSSNCATEGQGRWADAQTFVYDLARPLPGGLRCRFILKPGLRAQNGAPIQGRRLFAFDTGGPSIRASSPQDETNEIEEDQIFLLALNAPATPASLATKASCAIEGVGEEVPLDVLPSSVRDRILNGGKREWNLRWFTEQAGWRAPDDSQGKSQPRAEIIAAQCRRHLPAGHHVSLVWRAGIESPSGLRTSDAQRLDFKVRPPFTARFECQRMNAAARCLPITPMQLRFAGQVPVAQARAIRLVDTSGKARAPTIADKKARTVDSIEFAAPLPEATRFQLVLPQKLTDDAGRPLVNADRFPLAVETDDYPPLVKFSGTFGILEAAEGGVLPVTIRNVEATVAAKVAQPAVAGRAAKVDATDKMVADWMRLLDRSEDRTYESIPTKGSDEDRRIETTRSTPLIPVGLPAGSPEPRSISVRKTNGARAFEVVGIPLKRPGFYVVELASPKLGAALLGRGKVRYVATGALVTNMSVHFEWGRERSLVWVTTLDKATPVAGAQVAISDSCTGKRLWSGTSDGSGRALVTGALPSPESFGDCDYESHPLMVSARRGDDFSFTLTSWSRGIQPGDFNLPMGWGYNRDTYHTVFDRTLLRAGERINMKHIVRTRTDAGFVWPKLAKRLELTIRHLGSDQEYKLPVAIGPDGLGETSWAVPKDTTLGDYEVAIGEPKAEPHVSGRFSVDEFRLPTMKAVIQGPKEALVQPASAKLDLYVGYMSGGGVANAPVKLRTLVEPREVMLDDYPGFSFTSETLKPGIEPLDGDGEAARAGPIRAQVIPLTLNRQGAARVTVGKLGPVEQPSRLLVEMDYEDANGETLTAIERVPVEPARLRVGIATDGWLAKADDLRLKAVALDLHNRPIRGQKVAVELFSREIYSYRKRLIGGFYAYDNTRETKRLDATCDGRTDDQGLFSCKLDPGVSGEIIARVTAKDGDGHAAQATTTAWLVGDDEWWFGGDNGDRMDVVPERPEYAAGSVARFQVRMPFRQATALVTVMRDGVIDSFVTPLSGKDPVVEVRLKRGYAPNVYVSVLAVRGRVSGWRLWLAELARKWNLPWISREAAAPTALVDLAKPSYRLGIARIRVGWDDHRLAVRVTPDADRYAIRKIANIAVQVMPPKGRVLPRDAEIAVAAVDEALLSLKPNDSWDVLATMMAERPLFVFTSTAQTQVVGKRHYGRKALPTGGGGGADLAALARRDFNPLLLWRGRVRLDAQGRARLDVPLNDALSSFRIVAVATAGPDLFGTGQTNIRTTQDLMLLSGLPPVVRTGDRYIAAVTLRNATAKAMRVTVSARAGTAVLKTMTVDVPGGEARQAAWPVAAPANAGQVTWEVTASAGKARDRIVIVQSATPAVPVSTLQATLAQLDQPFVMMVARPAGALPGRGGVEVALNPKLAGTLAGVRDYMAAYPYGCIEQEMSRAIALGDQKHWHAYAQALPGYLDADGLVRFFPAEWLDGDDALTAYLLTLAHETGWGLPDAPRERMIGALTRFVQGRLDRGQGAGSFSSGDGAIRRLAALAALARYGRANAAMLEPLRVDPDRWPTTALLDWIDVLKRVPNVPDRDALLRQADHALRARLDLQGTAMSLARSDGLWWLMNSGDATAAKLLLTVADDPAWRADAGRIARGLMLRQYQGHWDTTVANATGTLAMARFSRRFESEPVSGATSIALEGADRRIAWPASGAPAAVLLPWPNSAQPLRITHEAQGAPWAMVSSRAAVPLVKPVAAGFAVRRVVTPVSQAVPGRWSRGDVMRIRLEVDSKAEMSWVVLNDPIPAGGTILGGSLGGRSQLLNREDASAAQGMPPSYVERRQEALRAYYAWVPKGRTSYEYTVRLNAVGQFQLPATRVEAMYLPEMFALLPNRPVMVAAAARP